MSLDVHLHPVVKCTPMRSGLNTPPPRSRRRRSPFDVIVPHRRTRRRSSFRIIHAIRSSSFRGGASDDDDYQPMHPPRPVAVRHPLRKMHTSIEGQSPQLRQSERPAVSRTYTGPRRERRFSRRVRSVVVGQDGGAFPSTMSSPAAALTPPRAIRGARPPPTLRTSEARRRPETGDCPRPSSLVPRPAPTPRLPRLHPPPRRRRRGIHTSARPPPPHPPPLPIVLRPKDCRAPTPGFRSQVSSERDMLRTTPSRRPAPPRSRVRVARLRRGGRDEKTDGDCRLSSALSVVGGRETASPRRWEKDDRPTIYRPP